MNYRQLVKGAEAISALGYGCMRFPTKRGSIDVPLAEQQMLLAYQNGVNYYDTAYPYHGGRSESVLGAFIKKNNLRDKVYIADKLPVFLVKKAGQIEKFFATQLKRLDTDYIDYYLMHSLPSFQTWQELKALGILDFIRQKKANGQIRYIGFSFHGRAEEFTEILNDYDWDFCQIQYNYLDENYQAGAAGLQLADKKQIGVVIMEPLRGGDLARVPDKVQEIFAEYPTARSAAHWALRWLWQQPQVSVVLSGMNDEAQIIENCQIADQTTIGAMDETELAIIERAKTTYQQLMKVPCTGCAYCMPCPYGVDIPGTFANYNSKYYFDTRMAQLNYIASTIGAMGHAKSGANLCRACGKCERQCPQNIAIIEELKRAHRDMDSMAWRVAIRLVDSFTRRRQTSN